MKLTDDCNTAVFKSVGIFYEKELHGQKSNTCRHIPEDEWDKFDLWARQPSKVIRIVQADDPDEYFERMVTDITCVCDLCLIKCAHMKVYVISWRD